MTTAYPTIGTATAPTVPAAPVQKNWWEQPGVTDAPTGLIGQTAQWTPTADQTVQGQIKNIIAEDSPLSQMAVARSNEQMNQRGLINSSINVGAGQKALYESALPIAQQDAATMANAGQFNANSTNALQSQSNTIRQQTATSNLQVAADQAKMDLDNQFKASMVNADAQTKAFLTQAEGEIKTKLANIDADYKTLIQTSASAGDIYKGTISQIGPILSDTNMDAASKTAAINGLFSRMGVAMNLVGSINGVDLGDLLQFGEVTVA